MNIEVATDFADLLWLERQFIVHNWESFVGQLEKVVTQFASVPIEFCGATGIFCGTIENHAALTYLLCEAR